MPVQLPNGTSFTATVAIHLEFSQPGIQLAVSAAGRPKISLTFPVGNAGIETRHYAPEVHVAAFALPPWIAALLDRKNKG